MGPMRGTSLVESFYGIVEMKALRRRALLRGGGGTADHRPLADRRHDRKAVLIRGDIFPGQLTPAGTRLFFEASDFGHGRELWVTDGTPEGTRMVRDIRPGSESAFLKMLGALDGPLLLHGHRRRPRRRALEKRRHRSGDRAREGDPPGARRLHVSGFRRSRSDGSSSERTTAALRSTSGRPTARRPGRPRWARSIRTA